MFGLDAPIKLFADLGSYPRWLPAALCSSVGLGVNLIVSSKMVVTAGCCADDWLGMIGLFTNPYVAIMLLLYRWFCPPGTVWRADYAFSSDVFGRRNEVGDGERFGMSVLAGKYAVCAGCPVRTADTIGFSPLFAVLAVFEPV